MIFLCSDLNFLCFFVVIFIFFYFFFFFFWGGGGGGGPKFLHSGSISAR